MHPIERLRMVARAEGAGPSLLATEAASALAELGDDAAGLVTACRRLIARHPTFAPVWWLAARVLAAADPAAEAWQAADELDDDPTPEMLAAAIPEDARVCVVGWPEQVALALRRRGDVRTVVVDGGGEGAALVSGLSNRGFEAVLAPDAGIAAAVNASDLVVLETSAMGPVGAFAAAGSYAAAAVARHTGLPVWLVAGTGRLLPGPLWDELCRRAAGPTPWDAESGVLPLDLVGLVVGPEGLEPVADAVSRPSCPVVPELLKKV